MKRMTLAISTAVLLVGTALLGAAPAFSGHTSPGAVCEGRVKPPKDPGPDDPKKPGALWAIGPAGTGCWKIIPGAVCEGRKKPPPDPMPDDPKKPKGIFDPESFSLAV